MEKRRYIFLIAALTVAFFIAVHPGFAGDNGYGQMASFPAFPAQLPPGKKLGTFQFSEPVGFEFSQKPEFPVDYVVADYDLNEVYRISIKSETPVCITCDLQPGSYQVRYKMTGKAKKDYWDGLGSEIFISPEGKRGYISSSCLTYSSIPAFNDYWRPYPIIRRKIKLIEPTTQAIITGKQVHFQWEPVPRADSYTVTFWPIQHPDHPESGFSAEIAPVITKGPELTVPVGFSATTFYLESNEVYSWTVCDGDSGTQQSRGSAVSRSRVFSTGAKERQANPSENYMRDEMIEPRLGIRLQQPYQPSDGSPVYLTVVAVGSQSSALKSGLLPYDRIATFDGKPVSTLNQFHDLLAAAPPGKTVTISTVYDDPKTYQTRTRSYSLVLP